MRTAPVDPVLAPGLLTGALLDCLPVANARLVPLGGDRRDTDETVAAPAPEGGGPETRLMCAGPPSPVRGFLGASRRRPAGGGPRRSRRRRRTAARRNEPGVHGGADEAARHAVDALLDADGSTAERCTTWGRYRPPELEPLKRIDEVRFEMGSRTPPTWSECGADRGGPYG